MLATLIRDSFADCPKELLAVGYSPESQVLVSKGKTYQVTAVARWREAFYLQVVNDANCPAWLPSWLFEVTDKTLPADWICTLQDDDLQMILGPEFIARDESSYTRMVELERDSVAAFWSHYSDHSSMT
ncbi:MAG: hypothetical protein WCN95_16900 [bacterium]